MTDKSIWFSEFENVPEKSEREKIDDNAKTLRRFYESYVSAGFTQKQAMQLVTATLTATIQNINNRGLP